MAIACFAAGTGIATDRATVPVDVLYVGDRVVTILDQPIQNVTWIGSRYINCARHNRPATVWPVRVARDAVGPGRPDRDLLLSQDHAIHMPDVLPR